MLFPKHENVSPACGFTSLRPYVLVPLCPCALMSLRPYVPAPLSPCALMSSPLCPAPLCRVLSALVAFGPEARKTIKTCSLIQLHCPNHVNHHVNPNRNLQAVLTLRTPTK